MPTHVLGLAKVVKQDIFSARQVRLTHSDGTSHVSLLRRGKHHLFAPKKHPHCHSYAESISRVFCGMWKRLLVPQL